MEKEHFEKVNHGLSTIAERRAHYLIGARLKDRVRIQTALRKQDEIRKRHRSPKGWNSTLEVRRWRERV